MRGARGLRGGAVSAFGRGVCVPGEASAPRRLCVCATAGETPKEKKPCWFSMQMTALVVTKALMLGLEK